MSSGPGTVRYRFEGEVWFYTNPGRQFFVSLPLEMSADIFDLIGNALNPWGTVPVVVTSRDHTWESSMFPRKDRKCYDLPLNGKVRKRLGLQAGEVIAVTIDIPLPA